MAKTTNKKVTAVTKPTGKVGGTNAKVTAVKKPGGRVGGTNKKQTVSPTKMKMGGAKK